MTAPLPAVKAFLIADAVIQDRLTRKWTVVNVFDQIFAPQVSRRPPRRRH